MNLKSGYVSSLFLTIAVLVSSSSVLSATPAPTDVPSTTKGPEVLTVGTGPYLGPLPEELAKLSGPGAPAPSEPAPAKEPEVSTIMIGSGNVLTVAELAKLAAYPVLLDSLPAALMIKPEPMEVSKIGIPELTPTEREKHAKESAVPQAAAPAAGSVR
jgi:hypothetical protein